MLTLFMALALPAHADNDCDGDSYDAVPSAYVDTCDGAPGDFRDVCSLNVFPLAIVCDLNGAPEDTDAEIYAATGDGSYSFWGTDSSGASFCCTFDDAEDIPAIGIVGSGRADVLLDWGGPYFRDLSGGVDEVAIGVFGGAGDDLIYTNSPYWSDRLVHELHGEGGDDTIECLAQCEAYGGDGADTIIGSESADLLYGDDTEVSGTYHGADRVSGRGGADDMHGGGGADLLCGEYGNDELYGEAGADALLGGDGTSDSANGGTGLVTDRCIAETEVGCEADVSLPAFCP